MEKTKKISLSMPIELYQHPKVQEMVKEGTLWQTIIFLLKIHFFNDAELANM